MKLKHHKKTCKLCGSEYMGHGLSQYCPEHADQYTRILIAKRRNVDNNRAIRINYQQMSKPKTIILANGIEVWNDSIIKYLMDKTGVRDYRNRRKIRRLLSEL